MTTTRKIIEIGYSRLIVLPKFWTEQYELGKGDSIKMKIGKNGDLILTKNEKTQG